MAIETNDEVRQYSRTVTQIKSALVIGAGETLNTVRMTDGSILVETLEGTNPYNQRLYRITLADARTMLSLTNQEEFEKVELVAPNVLITTRKRIV